MIQQKEPMLKKNISVGEVLGMAIALLGAGIIFYTTVQVRLSALELRMERSEQSNSEYRKNQEVFQMRLEGKIDGINEKINGLQIEVTKKKDR